MVRRRRWSPGTWRAIVYAVLVHLAAVAIFAVSLRWGQSRQPPGEVIEAVAVPLPEAKSSPSAAQASAEREAAEAQRRREEEEQARAQRAETERQRQIALQKKQEEERKRLEAERRKAEAVAAERRRREEEEKRRAAQEEKARKEKEAALRQKQAEEALRAQLEAEERARAEAARHAQELAAADRYRALIRQKVERNWSRPVGARPGLECIVRVRLTPGGEVLEARVVRGSGDAVFDRSVERAVYKAAPLPVPESREVFEQFRELEFIFKPGE